ncbi:hypothetical protein DL765_009618 [Monosporascus sp. GIB2]|nr:hypothetical protein DL765_009618 [Monosporascus sp. GIB2]
MSKCADFNSTGSLGPTLHTPWKASQTYLKGTGRLLLAASTKSRHAQRGEEIAITSQPISDPIPVMQAMPQPTSPSDASLVDLPLEIIDMIITELDTKSVLRLAQVSRDLNAVYGAKLAEFYEQDVASRANRSIAWGCMYGNEFAINRFLETGGSVNCYIKYDPERADVEVRRTDRKSWREGEWNSRFVGGGVTPLILAIAKRQPRIVQFLLERGAEANLPDMLEPVVLHQEIQQRPWEPDRVEYGDVYYSFFCRQSFPINWAATMEDARSIDLLTRRGADPNQKPLLDQGTKEAGWPSRRILPDRIAYPLREQPPIFQIFWYGPYAGPGAEEKALKALIKAGADVNIRDSWGLSPLEIAYLEHNQVALKLLRGAKAKRGRVPRRWFYLNRHEGSARADWFYAGYEDEPQYELEPESEGRRTPENEPEDEDETEDGDEQQDEG